MAQRLIDAARFERRLMFTVDRDEICDDCLLSFLNEMAEEPTIDQVKHGRWIGEQVEIGGSMCMECNRCHKIRAVDDYCSSCGARMDADE